MKYYPINEETARTAHYANSFRTFTPGEATEEYRQHVDYVYTLADKIADEKPQQADRAYYIADRYSKKLADHLNAYYRNEAACPSVMVCGPANFPVRKKQKQNSRRETLMNERNQINKYIDTLKGILYNTQPIMAGDADAIERLTDKIADLEADKELMKAINAHFRKHGNLDDFEQDIPDNLKRHIDFMIRNNFIRGSLFDTTNTNAEIKRCRARLEELTRTKEAGTTETENEFFRVVENVEIMRLQLFFDGKPDEETRNILKSNGFKWSPKNEAWQRQLTDNARRSLRLVMQQLTA